MIEVIIAIGVGGILCLLAISVMGRISDQGDEVKCQSALRQTGTAIHLYAQDHNGRFPHVSAVTGGAENHWRRVILPYVGLTNSSTDVRNTSLTCPTLRKVIVKTGGLGGIPNYGMNEYLSEVPVLSVERPSHTLLLTEAKLAPSGGNPSELHREGTITSANPHGRVHRNGQNVLYVDGRIEWVHEASRLGVAPYASGESEDIWSPRKAHP